MRKYCCCRLSQRQLGFLFSLFKLMLTAFLGFFSCGCRLRPCFTCIEHCTGLLSFPLLGPICSCSSRYYALTLALHYPGTVPPNFSYILGCMSDAHGASDSCSLAPNVNTFTYPAEYSSTRYDTRQSTLTVKSSIRPALVICTLQRRYTVHSMLLVTSQYVMFCSMCSSRMHVLM